MWEWLTRLWMGDVAAQGIKTPELAPHERWPEILHWRVGDEFDYVDMSRGMSSATLIALANDGYAYCWGSRYAGIGHKHKLPISCLVGHNQSLSDRGIDDAIKDTEGYMEMVRQFNLAYAELIARDRNRGVAA